MGKKNSMSQHGNAPQPVSQEDRQEEPLIIDDIVIETLAVDGICGVY